MKRDGVGCISSSSSRTPSGSVVIVLGEKLTRFRDTYKELYGFLNEFVLEGRIEKLGVNKVSAPVFVSLRAQVLDAEPWCFRWLRGRAHRRR
jgi:hypothetical protein